MLDPRNLRRLRAAIRFALPLAAACSGRAPSTTASGPADAPDAAPFVAQSCPDHGSPKRTDRALAIDPTNEDVVYLGVEGVGFYTTRDAGKSWARIVEGIRGYAVVGTTNLCYAEFYQTVVDARDPAHVCFTLNGDPGTIANPNSMYEGVYCSNDRGSHWSQRVTKTMNTAVMSVAIDPTDSAVLYASVNGGQGTTGQDYQTTGGIYKTTDGGGTWSELDTGWKHGQGVSEITIDPKDPRILYAAVMGVDKSGTPEDRFRGQQWGVLKSVDGGKSFTSQMMGMATAVGGQRAIQRVELAPGDSARLFVNDGADQPHGPYAYVSLDGAASFAAPSGTPDAKLDIFAYDPTDAKGLHMIGASVNAPSVMESTDGGQTWTAVASLPPGTMSNPVRLTNVRWGRQSGKVLYLNGSDATVYRSDDTGRTWTKILSTGTLPN